MINACSFISRISISGVEKAFRILQSSGMNVSFTARMFSDETIPILTTVVSSVWFFVINRVTLIIGVSGSCVANPVMFKPIARSAMAIMIVVIMILFFILF